MVLFYIITYYSCTTRTRFLAFFINKKFWPMEHG